jgi:hypothetical protein
MSWNEEDHDRDERGRFTSGGASEIDSAEKLAKALAEYNGHIYLPANEYGAVCGEVAKKNASLKGKKPKPVDFVSLSNDLYVYINTGVGNFTIVEKLDIEKNIALINSITEVINNDRRNK